MSSLRARSHTTGPSLEPNERELLNRYAGVANRMRLGRVRFRLTHTVFTAVIFGTKVLKRLLDVVIGGAALVLLAPFYIALAVAIRVESKGPVLFKQVRVGAQGMPFVMYKFRSMYLDAEERKKELAAENEMEGGVLFKMKHDPRVTRIGRFIRKASIDELPQLWNVLRGNMSLVGPRPPLPSEVADYSLNDYKRLEVRPGLTCIWQVTGRSDIPFEQQVELDSLYIESQSFGGDLKLLLKTIPAVLLSRGAY